jgi:hypothetical protein
VFAAADFNTFVRDNLNQTAPALASAAGQFFVASGPNAITAATVGSATVATSQSTTSTSYADLATVGPTVTVNVQSLAVVIISAQITNNVTNASSFMSYTVSGATSVAVSTTRALIRDGMNGGNAFRASAVSVMPCNPGSNIFKAKYAAGPSSTATFADRNITVIPF